MYCCRRDIVLGAELRALRTELGRTGEEVAAAMEWDRTKVYRIEGGKQWIRPKELRELLANNVKVVVHGEEVGDRLLGIMGGFIRWSGLVDDGSQAITVSERIAGHQLDPSARELILRVHELR